jgi:glutaredoxin 3
MNINIYTKSNCPNCDAAKQLLKSKGLDYLEIDVELGNRWQNLLKEFPDARQMPQIFIDDQRVGGLAGLQAALKKIEVNKALDRLAQINRDLGLEY